MKLSSKTRGFKLIEMLFTLPLISVLGLVIYSLLTTGTILGAKNTAVNVAHQQARTAMLQMMQDLHSSVSQPHLIDVNGALVDGQGPAEGVSFQVWAIGPGQVTVDADKGDTKIKGVSLSAKPVVGQIIILPLHGIEEAITAVSATNPYNISIAHALAVDIEDTSTTNVMCFITQPCSYTVKNGALDYIGPGATTKFAVLGNNITSPAPFSVPATESGALYFRVVSAIDLSTADMNYNNRGFKSANILLNGQVPARANLTVSK